MKRTDSTTVLTIPCIYITFDEPGEISRWNEAKYDLVKRVNLITEYSEINYTTPHCAFYLCDDSYLFVNKKENKIFKIKVVTLDQVL